VREGQPIRVAGAEDPSREAIARGLRKAGFGQVEAGDDLPSQTPAALVVTGDDAAALVARARELPALRDVPILAVVPPTPEDAAAAAIAAGADDVIPAPPVPEVMANRLRHLIGGRADKVRARKLEQLQTAMLRLQDLMVTGGDAPDVMQEILLGIVETLEFERASLIAHVEASEFAYVVAATDDPAHNNFALAIADYPELAEAIRTRAPVLIDDALSDPITARAADALAAVGVRGIAVFPVVWRQQSLGAVLLRRSSPGLGHLDPDRIAFGTVFANLLAEQLRHV
jgi:CheY-like chemotaxis protein